MNLFIAPKIKVGFQKRNGTFTGQLGYVIYYDEKGKLRKEKSWEGWRDKSIDPVEFDNIPTSGFTINKDIKRYNGEWWSSTRTMVRIHDPRGFEFEVTTENLIAILMHTDCSKRGLIGEFVYAWDGPELVLLPTNSLEYEGATKFTLGLNNKIRAKDLIIGATYKHKRKKGEYVYMGKLNYYRFGGPYAFIGPRKESKEHIFFVRKGVNITDAFIILKNPNDLSECINDQCDSDFASLMDKYKSKVYAGKIVKIEPVKVNIDLTEQINEKYSKDNTYYYMFKPVHGFVKSTDGVFRRLRIIRDDRSVCVDDPTRRYFYSSDTDIVEFHTDTQTITRRAGPYQQGYYYNKPTYTAEQVLALDLYQLKITFDTGKTLTITDLDELIQSL